MKIAENKQLTSAAGCPHNVFDWAKMCEVCKLTKKPTGDAVQCDFWYDTECDTYKKNAEKRRGRLSPVPV